jgi:hypothetical protein
MRTARSSPEELFSTEQRRIKEERDAIAEAAEGVAVGPERQEFYALLMLTGAPVGELEAV